MTYFLHSPPVLRVVLRNVEIKKSPDLSCCWQREMHAMVSQMIDFLMWRYFRIPMEATWS